MITNEQVQFRLFLMPCCGHLLCWVNPRLPSYCPACGKQIYKELKFEIEHTKIDSPAWLKIQNGELKP